MATNFFHSSAAVAEFIITDASNSFAANEQTNSNLSSTRSKLMWAKHSHGPDKSGIVKAVAATHLEVAMHHRSVAVVKS